MPMTPADELRITIDDALEVARRVAIANDCREVSLVIVKLTEALMWAERLETTTLEPRE